MSDDTDLLEGNDEMERCQARRVTFWLVTVIAIFLGAAVVVAHAEETPRFSMEDQNGKLTLDTKACVAGGWLAKWKSANWFFQGKPYEACWTVQNKIVVVIDSTGEVSAIQRERFKREEGI